MVGHGAGAFHGRIPGEVLSRGEDMDGEREIGILPGRILADHLHGAAPVTGHMLPDVAEHGEGDCRWGMVDVRRQGRERRCLTLH